MARKHLTVGEFALFNVLYEDGSQSSNRKVPVSALGGLDGDTPALEIIESQPTAPSMRVSSSTTRTCAIGSSSGPP